MSMHEHKPQPSMNHCSLQNTYYIAGSQRYMVRTYDKDRATPLLNFCLVILWKK